MTEPIRLVIAGTGHRPPRLGLDYTPESNRLLTNFATAHLLRMQGVVPDGHIQIGGVISGMAQGWDQALAHAAIDLGLPLTCAVAFEGQEARWPQNARDRFHAILRRASVVHVVRPGGYHPSKFIDRDRWMVDHADMLLALWDGSEQGGTWETVAYARRRDVPVGNVWRSWAGFRDGVSSLGGNQREASNESGAPSLGGPAR